MSKNIILIPTYNCESQISKVLDELVQMQNVWDEIWIIDNQSSDRTIEAVTRFQADSQLRLLNLKLFQNTINCGLGGSHKLAIQRAKVNNFDTITVFHGDYQGKLSDAQKMLEIFEKNKNDVILGTRFSSGSTLMGYDKKRKLFNLLMNFLFSIRLNRKVHDLGSGVNLFKVKAFDGINWSTIPNDLTFNIELLMWIVKQEKSYIWQPITWCEEDQVSNVKVMKQVLQTFLILLNRNRKNFTIGDQVMMKEIRIE